MKRVCSYCKDQYGETVDEPREAITHGMCESCASYMEQHGYDDLMWEVKQYGRALNAKERSFYVPTGPAI